MTSTDSLRAFRPANAVKRLGDNPALLLSGLLLQRALTEAGSRLPVFELASVGTEARGLLRAAQHLDVAIGVSFRPRLDAQARPFGDFVRDLLRAADIIGFRHPILLSAGPLYLSSLDATAIDALDQHLFEAIDAGFTDLSIAPTGKLDRDAVLQAIAPAARQISERGLLLELALPSTAEAREWQASCQRFGVAVEVFSSSEQAGERGLVDPPAAWGLRPRDAQLPDAFDLRVSRLTLDPFSEIAIQVLPDEVRDEIDEHCSHGFRLTDVLGLKAGELDALDELSATWIESNIHGYALELFEALSVQGSAEIVRRFIRDRGEGAFDL
ncbi:MAG: hypothetical protein IKC51_04090 [Myxococcaceae bacterium]|nr:hypothetical protein [Myxococcaceae bacterium]